jgi:hypothetical protein
MHVPNDLDREAIGAAIGKCQIVIVLSRRKFIQVLTYRGPAMKKTVCTAYPFDVKKNLFIECGPVVCV